MHPFGCLRHNVHHLARQADIRRRPQRRLAFQLPRVTNVQLPALAVRERRSPTPSTRSFRPSRTGSSGSGSTSARMRSVLGGDGRITHTGTGHFRTRCMTPLGNSGVSQFSTSRPPTITRSLSCSKHVSDHFDERLTHQHLDLRAVAGSGVLGEQAQPFGPMPQQLGVNVDGPAPHRHEPPHPSHRLHDIEHRQPGVVRLRQLDRGAQHLRFEVPGRCRHQNVLEPVHHSALPVVLCATQLLFGNGRKGREPLLRSGHGWRARNSASCSRRRRRSWLRVVVFVRRCHVGRVDANAIPGSCPSSSQVTSHEGLSHPEASVPGQVAVMTASLSRDTPLCATIITRHLCRCLDGVSRTT